MLGKIFGIALVFLLIASMLAFADFAPQSQTLAWEVGTWHVDDDK